MSCISIKTLMHLRLLKNNNITSWEVRVTTRIIFCFLHTIIRKSSTSIISGEEWLEIRYHNSRIITNLEQRWIRWQPVVRLRKLVILMQMEETWGWILACHRLLVSLEIMPVRLRVWQNKINTMKTLWNDRQCWITKASRQIKSQAKAIYWNSKK